ncbi:hypothetical protein PT974_08674 [Cladobotryum mycophilum]|uniref:C3H1-type domain-containing protein n=1 Tax=Cladobotryum mycophilum TaxID=491253 RepID=A0ABR0SEX6_9HYPO
MLNDDEIERAASQLADYRLNDTLPQILDRYSTLIADYRRLKSDYEEERDAREKYKQLAKGQGRNLFVLVLVDGDGYVFNDNLVSKGADGGSSAAQLLNEAVKTKLREKDLEHCQVMVRVFANVVGLSKSLHKAGLAGAEKRSLAPFVASFNRSFGLTDFIDAGELKENADFKLRSILRLYAENNQCKHIFFAACHDVGYISDLTPYMGNRERFTLIATPGIRFHNEFNKLGMGVEELPGVFRSTPLDVSATKSAGGVVKASSPGEQAHNSHLDDQKVCRFFPLGQCKYGKSCKNLHIKERSNMNTSYTAQTNDIQSDSNGFHEGGNRRSPSFALRQASEDNIDFKNGHGLSLSYFSLTKLPKKDDIPEGRVAINKNSYRLDPHMSPSSSHVIERLRTLTASQRACNSFHLNGFCESGFHCEYSHSSLDEELKEALEALARSMPCSKRGECRDRHCTYGHVCQKIDCKHRGGKTHCKLPFLSHIEDLAVAKYVPAIEKPSSYSWQGSSYNHSTTGSSVNEEIV